MLWTKEVFLDILDCTLAKKLFIDEEIAHYTSPWRVENKAALLHANGITKETSFDYAKALLQLVAAFSRKDIPRMRELIFGKKVSVGARLDYLLPLYDATNDGGEDIFVASTKIMLGGNRDNSVSLSYPSMVHQSGENKGRNYTKEELSELENYVNGSFAIRELLKSAPNHEIILPTKQAIKFIITQAKNYRDSNDNPPIVFIPGALSISNYPITKMLEKLMNYGADVNEVGFFSVPGIVWSIILADIDSVRAFLELGAAINIEDDMGNKVLSAWVGTTYQVVEHHSVYAERLREINQLLQDNCELKIDGVNHFQKTCLDYLEGVTKSCILSKSLSL